MSKYRELRLNQPKLTIKEGAREVIFQLVSCMCDNVSFMKFYKNDNGDFRVQATTKHGMGNAFSNYQMKHTKEEIEWEADDNMWGGVIAMINSGTSVIESVKSR
jgi:hypothetical protein